jgi:hypothetical protein
MRETRPKWPGHQSGPWIDAEASGSRGRRIGRPKLEALRRDPPASVIRTLERIGPEQTARPRLSDPPARTRTEPERTLSDPEIDPISCGISFKASCEVSRRPLPS